MNTEQVFLIAGGTLTVAGGFFHLAFWRLFDWKNELPRLRSVNRGIMQVLNIQIAVIAFVLGFVTLRYSSELSSTAMGNALIWGIAVFWIIRTINQPLFWGMKSGISRAFTAVWAVLALTYLIPALI
jgi:hypothetical protein